MIKHMVQLICDSCGLDAESRSPGATHVEHFDAHGDAECELHLCAVCREFARKALLSTATTISVPPKLLRVLVPDRVRKAVGA